MKKTILKFAGKQVYTGIIFIATFVIATPFQTRANNVNKETVTDSTIASMQYLGSSDDGLLFDVRILNPEKSKFTLLIQDENGNVLYSNRYQQMVFIKKFKVLRDEDVNRYSFIITSRDKNLAQTFTVTSTEKNSRKIEITRL